MKCLPQSQHHEQHSDAEKCSAMGALSKLSHHPDELKLLISVCLLTTQSRAGAAMGPGAPATPPGPGGQASA